MKTKSFFTLLVVVALCFYGCEKSEIEELVIPATPTDGTEPDNSGDNTGEGEIYSDIFFSEQGDGTLENPYNVSQVIEMINDGTYNLDKAYYVKGIVSTVVEEVEFPNGYRLSYFASRNGQYSASTDLYVSYGFGLGGEYFTSKSDLSETDKIIVYGKFSENSHYGPEIFAGQLCYLNGETADIDELEDEYYLEPGEGTAESPYTVSQAVEMINDGTYDPDQGYYVKGIDTGELHSLSSLGYANYYISENGYHIEGCTLFVYRGYGLGEGIKNSAYLLKGDRVVVYGRFANDDDGPRIIDSQMSYLNREATEVDEWDEFGDGTRQKPYTFSQASEKMSEGAYIPERGYYVKGIVSHLTSRFYKDSSIEWRHNYYFSVNGEYSYSSGTNVYVPKGYGLGGNWFTPEKDLSRMDKIIVYGRLDGDSFQMDRGKLYYWNEETGNLDEAEYYIEPGDGTMGNPLSIFQVREMINDGSYDPDMCYYVKGVVCSVRSTTVSGGCLNYDISEDGDTRSDSAVYLYIYKGCGLTGANFTSVNDLLEGNSVVVYGKLANDNGICAMTDSELFYLNGKASDDGFEDVEPGEGTIDSPYTVDQVVEVAETGSYDSKEVYFIKGIVANISAWDGDAGCMSYSISETGSVDETCFYVRDGYGLGGEKITSYSYLSEGDKVVVYGEISLSSAGTPEMVNGKLYYLNGKVAENVGADEGEDVCRYMTDSKFINYCLNNFDSNKNGKISFAEAEAVTTINCSTATDFTGIEYFTNLKTFTSTSVKYVDFSNNAELTSVKMNGAPIEQLDLSHNTKLTSIRANAFDDCGSLTSASLPESLTEIGNYAFRNCISLVSATIPSLTSLDSYAFYGCTSLEAIVLPEGVKTISGHSFYGCSSLTSITLPNSVTTINTYAFYNCKGLLDVSLPSKLTSIGEYAFYGCRSLTSVAFPSGLSSIERSSFSDCSSLKSISFLGDNITTIKEYSFYGCSSLISVTFPSNLTSIGEGAFKGCTSLASISFFGESLTTIETSAFNGCTNLMSVAFPSGLTSLGESAFEGCTGLVSVSFSGENLASIGNKAFYKCSNLNSVSFSENGFTEIGTYAFYQCTSLSSVEPSENSLATIGDYAFSECSGLKFVSFSNGLTTIGEYAFNGCTGMTDVVFSGNSLTSVGDYCFYGCSNLTNVSFLNGSLTSIGKRAFYNCANLTSVSFADNSLSSIGNDAFSGCGSLVSVSLTKGLTSIGDYAFYQCTGMATLSLSGDNLNSIGGSVFSGCTNLESVSFSGNSRISIGSDMFKNCKNLTSLSFYDDSVSSIGNSAFSSFTKLTGINFMNNGLASIGDNAFEGCTGLTSISFADNSLVSIGDYAFSECSGLVSAELPKGLTLIGSHAFYECGSVTSVSFPEGLTTIGDYAFYECGNLTSTELLKGLTTIGSYAFYKCSSLTSASFPKGLTAINEYTFYGCSKLSTISFPEGLTTIGDYAFTNCSGLESVSIQNGLSSIGDNAFRGCGKLESVVFPEELTTIGTYAFYNCTSLGSVIFSGNKLTKIMEYTFQNCTSLASVIFSEGLESIGEKAFYNCGLQSASFPASLSKIDDSAFSDCTSLTSISFSEGSLTTIGSHAFSDCSNLTSIDSPANSVATIGDYAFYKCFNEEENLKHSIEFHKGLTEIGEYSFYGCWRLRYVSLDETSITVIPAYAFDQCGSMYVTFPSTLTSIKAYAFNVTPVLIAAIYAKTPPSIAYPYAMYTNWNNKSSCTLYAPSVISYGEGNIWSLHFGEVLPLDEFEHW